MAPSIAEYKDPEARVDALRDAHLALLKITAVYKTEAPIGTGITNFAATNLKGTNLLAPAPAPVVPPAQQHKTLLPHAIGRASTDPTPPVRRTGLGRPWGFQTAPSASPPSTPPSPPGPAPRPSQVHPLLAAKSVKELADAWAARCEPHKGGEWRCSGCQAPLRPRPHRCFCNAVPSPRARASPLLRLPVCLRPSGVRTPLPAPLPPRPLPPVPHHHRPAVAVCGRTLACGAHACTHPCHADARDRCPVRETVRCWCGKHEKEVGCGEGEAAPCSSFEESWIGPFVCADSCDRLFACGVHRCAQPCHPASGAPAPCPRSPENVRTCPCRHRAIAIAGTSAPLDAAGNAFPPRADCTARIPTCGARCGSILSCVCRSVPRGRLPPVHRARRAAVPVRREHPRHGVLCRERKGGGGAVRGGAARVRATPVPARVLPACGHRGVQLKNKGKKRANNARAGEKEGIGEERGRAARLVCPCGLTVLEPPIPCGMRIRCTYPCPRPPPACGHPRTPHTCHEDDVGCPPLSVLGGQAETHALELRCNLCTQGKLRSLRDIKRHVDKHNVRVPSEADWTRVELIVRATPMPGGDADADADSNLGTTGA
ncbi:hypothetical protein B0H14DRAFT_3876391 [Mycena olivaceomarginata]|nr:hypothetical protein B0H14DRAFT_3876391 [Mycena olivaceomarginata]